MYEVIKSVIDSGDYELTAMLAKIDTMWVKGKLTEEQHAELMQYARDKADPVNSYKPLQERLDAALAEIDGLKSTMQSLSDRVYKLEHLEEEPEEPTEPEEPEEWPEYVQPTGAHDAYNVGDKVTYNGKRYVCVLAACVWTPDAYPQGWKTEEEWNAMQKEQEQME
nr:MAG TPA: ChiA1-BD-binding domain protein [Caudoviricetes sp.]